MTKVLLVGINYTGDPIADVEIDVLGLCRPEICDPKAAYSLYEYNVIIIHPKSYSHFIFGAEGKHSSSEDELWELKKENNNHDLDTVYYAHDREAELNAAIDNGSRVIWLLTTDKRTNFFGWRSLYLGYANEAIYKILKSSEVHLKKSKMLSYIGDNKTFEKYFDQLKIDGWRMCVSDYGDKLKCIAHTPEMYCLGGEIETNKNTSWLLTAPTSEKATNILVLSSLGLGEKDVKKESYHGIFLSHTSTDKPFVRKLKKDLELHGVENVWVDEAEIEIGDSLTKKIEEGLTKTKYIGVVLSPKAIESGWVQRELEIAINREITSGEVVILPLLYEPCELPAFLSGKLYADFTTSENHEESLSKLLRRLKIK